MVQKINAATPLDKSSCIIKFTAGDIYCSDRNWANPLPIISLKDMLTWNDGEDLKSAECLDLHNRWLIPIWNALCSVNTKSTKGQEKSTDGGFAESKTDLLDLFWTIHECLSVPELNFGIILRPRSSRK